MDSETTWKALARDYETARSRLDSLDSLLEWPAQLALIGDVQGKSILDVGCGNGAKAVQLARLGASHVVGVDISGEFVTPEDDALDVMLLTADLSHLDQVTALSEQRFDVVLFLQSIGYAEDQVATLRAARQLIKDEGILVIARSSPVRFAVERSERDGIGLGTAYHSSAAHTYPSGWNDKILVSHRTNTFSDMINTVSEAGFRIDRAVEPQLSDQQKAAYPHKQAWLDKYIGIILFRARPLSPA